MSRPTHIRQGETVGSASSAPTELGSDDVSLELSRHLAAFRRQIPLVITSMLMASLAGVVVATDLPRYYTANSLVLLDNKRVRAVEDNYDSQSVPIDNTSSYIESQVEVIRSAQVAESVIRKMNLLEKPLPVAPSPIHVISSPFKYVVKLIKGNSPSENNPGKLLQSTIMQLQSGLEVRHMLHTQVIQISYVAPTPSLAADIANAYAEAFINDQLNAKYEVTRRASAWLKDRLTELKQQSYDAELALQDFRAKNHLIFTSGKLINEQQIADLNSQLITARSDHARAEARFGRLKQIIANHETHAVVSDTFGSGIVEALRTKYLDASKREAELKTRVGPEHASLKSIRREIEQYEKQIFDELARLAEAYRSEVDIASARENALSASMRNLIANAESQNKTLAASHNLEQQAENLRSLYESYSKRYQESLQQQSFPIAEARVITPAFEPTTPSHPKKAILTLMFTLLGGIVGVGVGLYREQSEKGFTNEAQVRDRLNIDALGIIPVIQAAPNESPSPQPPRQSSEKGVALLVPAFCQVTSHRDGLWNYILTHPNSRTGETLLAAKLAVDTRCDTSRCKVIGIASALPGEGKTLVAKNFASLLASLRARVLLMDGDLRKRALSSELTPQAAHGLIQVITGKCDIASVLHVEPQSSLHVLPVVKKNRITHTSDVLASFSMHNLLKHLRSNYDYIVIDLPPLGPVIDACAISSNLDAFIFVIEWRQTPKKLIHNLLLENARVREKCVGAILNKVDVEKLTLFAESGSRYHQYKNYERTYYRD